MIGSYWHLIREYETAPAIRPRMCPKKTGGGWGRVEVGRRGVEMGRGGQGRQGQLQRVLIGGSS